MSGFRGACLPVSVVIPCYRCADTIGRAVGSVLAQTAQPMEVILVDDASDELTASVLRRLAREFEGAARVRLIVLEKNAGAATARNAGWNAAREKYVAFLDSDASWHPRKLEVQHRFMELRPDVSVSAHRHAVTAGVMDPAPVPDQPPFVVIDFHGLLWKNRFVPSSVMVQRELPLRFCDGQRYMEDHRLWLDVACARHRIVRLEIPLAAHHKPDFGAAGLSANLVAMEQAELANYRVLWRKRAVGTPMLVILAMWSLMKFVRRLLVVGMRRVRAAHEHAVG